MNVVTFGNSNMVNPKVTFICPALDLKFYPAKI